MIDLHVLDWDEPVTSRLTVERASQLRHEEFSKNSCVEYNFFNMLNTFIFFK